MTTLKLFEPRQVRSVWDQENEAWLFSIVDVVGVLIPFPDRNATCLHLPLQGGERSEGATGMGMGRYAATRFHPHPNPRFALPNPPLEREGIVVVSNEKWNYRQS